MINPLTLGTDGAIKRGTRKAVLVLGVSGMLFFVGSPIPPIPPSSVSVADGRSMEEKRVAEIRHRVQADDAEIVAIINAFLQCQS